MLTFTYTLKKGGSQKVLIGLVSYTYLEESLSITPIEVVAKIDALRDNPLMPNHNSILKEKINSLIQVVTDQGNLVSTIDDTLVNVATSFFFLLASIESLVDTSIFTINIVEPKVVTEQVIEDKVQDVDALMNPKVTKEESKLDAFSDEVKVAREVPTFISSS
ncbi:hypothetical protein PVK06_005611 [Gossypium arboreum]|uniref:Uncharacterized protein n=1 Tax=Gossypium arboreum TaxID=29729 RepID=A0ABR0QW32_GOSAR|nr:hypothetical protein PVK06_005611 [Gossypium arboreum]